MEKQITPELPKPVAAPHDVYVLAYRTSKRMETTEFYCEGGHEAAIAAGRKLCMIRKTNFLNVAPRFEDINEIFKYEESKKLEPVARPGVVI